MASRKPGRTGPGRHWRKQKLNSPRSRHLVLLLRVPTDFPLVSFQCLILPPTRDLTVSSPPSSNHTHTHPWTRPSLPAPPGRPWGDGRRRPSGPSGREGTRHPENFSRDGGGGTGEVERSGRREAGKTKDSSPAPERAPRGETATPARSEKSPRAQSRQTAGPGDQVPKAVLHPLPFCLP